MNLHAGLAAITFLLILIYYPARPEDLPSYTAGEKREDFLPGLRTFLTNRWAEGWRVKVMFCNCCNAGMLFWSPLLSLSHKESLKPSILCLTWTWLQLECRIKI